ncbi:MAG: hypothetical protein Edafosvirus17_6 [Edafosvirus sp.]|uniref:Nudix hydrolase domain-containing protein n=1 Tax=Edafosvirus sp. TaxID=2487765 RepID=A0A3G4ZUF2_9VIRU|nr:MAG: hypothetical protein Edafosvirus17_6 [Edafosvirus sp.]
MFWQSVIIAITLALGITCYKAVIVWNSVTNPKHKKEWLHLYWFFYGSYGKTGIKLPRAFLPMFRRFERKKFGLIFEASRVVVINNSKDGPLVLLCQFAEKRRKNGIEYDLGAAGMVPIESTPIKTAGDELGEELGIKNVAIKYCGTVMPFQGYSCIIHMYVVNMSLDTVFTDRDDTYSDVQWIPISEWSKYEKKMRPDVVLTMRDLDRICK